MSAIQWIINSEATKQAFFANVNKLFDEHRYLTYSAPRLGKDRSLTQNALFHVWLTEMTAWKDNVHTKSVTREQLESMKDYVKECFLLHNPDCYSWVVIEYTNRRTGKTKKKYTSSASWKTGEMFMVLEFMQNWTAKAGLILESKGEFAKKQREQNK